MRILLRYGGFGCQPDKHGMGECHQLLCIIAPGGGLLAGSHRQGDSVRHSNRAATLHTRARIEAFASALVLSVMYFALPNAIKVIISGGSGGIGEGLVVTGAYGSMFGDRVTLSVVMAMTVPFALFLGRRSMLLPRRWLGWRKPGMLGVIAACVIAIIGTFARTGLLAGGATLLMLGVRSRRKLAGIVVVALTALAILMIAPENWFVRMDTIFHYQNDNSAMSRLAVWRWAWDMAVSHPIVGGGFGVFQLDAGNIPATSAWIEAHNIFFEMMGEHGFVGLGLFCFLIIAIYWNCAVIQRLVRGHENLTWTADLARAAQIALVAFLVGGSFVSIASNPYLYILAAITVGTRGLVRRELSAIARPRAAIRASDVAQPAE